LQRAWPWQRLLSTLTSTRRFSSSFSLCGR
jgi:hypothetical protein